MRTEIHYIMLYSLIFCINEYNLGNLDISSKELLEDINIYKRCSNNIIYYGKINPRIGSKTARIGSKTSKNNKNNSNNNSNKLKRKNNFNDNNKNKKQKLLKKGGNNNNSNTNNHNNNSSVAAMDMDF